MPKHQFFDEHIENQDWAFSDDYWAIWDQFKAMKLGLTEKVCKVCL
jgi:hypothetical protein